MGVIVPVDMYNATFIFGCTGTTKTPTWTCGFDTNPVSGNISAEDMADRIYAAFTDTTTGSTGPYTTARILVGWRFSGVSVSLMTEDGPLVGESTGAVVGLSNFAPLPINCSLLATKSTSKGGRKNRGRAYLPPHTTDELNVDQVGVINSTGLGLLQAEYNRAFQQLATESIVPMLFHSDGSAATEITDFSIGSTIATQRRRLR